MKLFTKMVLVLTFGLIITNVNAQFKDFGLKGGIQINGVMPATEFEDDNGLSLSSYLFRGFLRFELSKLFNLEVGAGYGNLTGDDYNYATNTKGTGKYSTSIIPIDARILITPFNLESLNPYIYGGIGLLNYNVNTKPNVISPLAVEENGWTAVFPFGIGTEIKLSEQVLLDLSAGVNLSLTENLNYYKIVDVGDGYINFGIGITFTGENMNSDKDKDGLTKREELELGTDPNNSDTDRDGLSDGAEVKQYYTNPLNADSDGDGLKDGEEVFTYKTNPNKADSDADGLNDGDEVFKYKTDPLNADTDGDGLKDGEEILKYKTDPLNPDTDKDGLKDGEEIFKYVTDPLNVDTDSDMLNDGEEIMKYNTDPLKMDTDGGTINDGVEVKRGTNPLDPKDDLPMVNTEKEMEFDHVLFVINSANLSKADKKTLDGVYDTFAKYKNGKLFLSGHTCSLGSEEYNMKLSIKRVNAAKNYLVKKGISADAITTEAFGELKPAFPNDTEIDRAKNRRTEIKAVFMEMK